MTANPPIHSAPTETGGDGFLAALIRRRCAAGEAEAGAVFRISLPTVSGGDGEAPVEGDADILAIHPALLPDAALPNWVEPAARAASVALRSGGHAPTAAALNDDRDGSASQWIVTIPLRFGIGDAPSALASFLVTASRESIEGAMAGLGDVRSEFESHEQRLRGEPRTPAQRMNDAVAPLLAANTQDRFFGAAVGVCNSIESTTGASRVSLGFLRGRDLRLGAISHTEKIVRSMQLVRDIEDAMEECIDQDGEVITPAPEGSPTVDRAANELARKHGPASVCVVPLRRDGAPVGALCVEREPARPLTAMEVESIRLASELFTPRLHELFGRDRWFGARMAASVRASASSWLGPTHTWAKLLAIAGFLLIAFCVLVKGPDRVSAPFTLQTVERRVAPAPFDGYLESRSAQIGDSVRAGDVLATLDSSGLRLERAEAVAGLEGYRSEADQARGAGKAAEALIAEAHARELEASVALLDWRIDRATLRAPIDGVVVQGDLDTIIGAPVRAGDTLFVVAPLGALRGELLVDAARIADVGVGAGGSLATTADPSARVQFVVTRIDPIPVGDAEGAEMTGEGGYRVIVELSESPGWLRPGMEGVAKIDAGRKRYATLWTRRLVDWVRLRLWI